MSEIAISHLRIGDWVRYQYDRRLVIGVIQYIRPRNSWESHDTLVLDVGEIECDQVLEARQGVPSPSVISDGSR